MDELLKFYIKELANDMRDRNISQLTIELSEDSVNVTYEVEKDGEYAGGGSTII